MLWVVNGRLLLFHSIALRFQSHHDPLVDLLLLILELLLYFLQQFLKRLEAGLLAQLLLPFERTSLRRLRDDILG